MGFLAPIGAAIMEAMPAIGAGAAAAGEGAAATGALGALGTGAAEAGLGAGSAFMSAAPGIAGAATSMAPELAAGGAMMPAGMGLLAETGSGAVAMPSIGAPAAQVGLAQSLSEPSLLAKLGLDTPRSLVNATNQGVETLAKLRAMNPRSPYVVAPNLHSGGGASAIKFGNAVQRKSSPLEEFALLLRRAGM